MFFFIFWTVVRYSYQLLRFPLRPWIMPLLCEPNDAVRAVAVAKRREYVSQPSKVQPPSIRKKNDANIACTGGAARSSKGKPVTTMSFARRPADIQYVLRMFSEQFQMFSTRLSPTSPSPWNCSISPLASAALSESAPGNCVEDRFLLSISAQRFSLTFDIPQLSSTASLARSTAQKLGQSSPFRRTHDSPYSISSRDLFFQGRQIRCVAANKGIDPLLATLSRNLPFDLWPRLQHLVYVRMFMYVYVSLYKSCMCEGGKLFLRWLQKSGISGKYFHQKARFSYYMCARKNAAHICLI